MPFGTRSLPGRLEPQEDHFSGNQQVWTFGQSIQVRVFIPTAECVAIRQGKLRRSAPVRACPCHLFPNRKCANCIESDQHWPDGPVVKDIQVILTTDFMFFSSGVYVLGAGKSRSLGAQVHKFPNEFPRTGSPKNDRPSRRSPWCVTSGVKAGSWT